MLRVLVVGVSVFLGGVAANGELSWIFSFTFTFSLTSGEHVNDGVPHGFPEISLARGSNPAEPSYSRYVTSGPGILCLWISHTRGSNPAGCSYSGCRLCCG